MRQLLLLPSVLLLPGLAGAADILPSCTPATPAGTTLSCVVAATFPAKNDFLCFEVGGDSVCDSQHIATDDDGVFVFEGRYYSGAPSGALFVSARRLNLMPGEAVGVRSGNDFGELVAEARFVAPAAPPDAPEQPVAFAPTDIGPVVDDGGTPPAPTPAPGPGLIWREDFEGALAAWHNTSTPGEPPAKHGKVDAWPACEHGKCLKQDQGTSGWGGSWQREFGLRDQVFMKLRLRVGPMEKDHHFWRMRGPNDVQLDTEPEFGRLQQAFFWPGSEYTWRTTANFPLDQWVELAVYVKLNTPGVANGELHTWVNGEHRFAAVGHKVRNTADGLETLELVSNTDGCTPGGCVYHFDDVEIYGEVPAGYSLAVPVPIDSTTPVVR